MRNVGWRLEHSYAALPQVLYSAAVPATVRDPGEDGAGWTGYRKTVLAKAVRLVFEGRVFLSGRRTIVFG